MNKYTTTDFYLAAALRAAGYLNMEVIGEGKQKTFSFDDSSDLRVFVEAYWNDGDEAKVPALVYANEIKNLKGMMFNFAN